MQSRAFRRMFSGTFTSNIGTWMQNVALISLAYDLTRDAAFNGIITFAQLGPMLFLSPFGGALADRINRRTLIILLSLVQLTMSIVLAVVALSDTPNKVVMVLVVASIGCANAVNGPTMNALLPTLVPREDMQPAIAINSVSMNASRVIGPLLGSLVMVLFDEYLTDVPVVSALPGASAVFFLNGLTYLFVIWAIAGVEVDFTPKGRAGLGPMEQLREGLAAARKDVLITRVLITISVLSLCSLIFIYQMPILAEEHLGLEGWQFNLLFACFALGAAGGALSMGSFLSGHDRAHTIKGALFVFAAALAVFGTTRIIPVAFVTVFILGAAYFVIVTALSTTLQMRVPDEVRGRVMGLWMMAWAGFVPLGGLIAGPIIDAVSISAVLIFGAIVAAVLGLVMDLRDPELHALGAE
ncbi:MFS transporter [soil metagenome]